MDTCIVRYRVSEGYDLDPQSLVDRLNQARWDLERAMKEIDTLEQCAADYYPGGIEKQVQGGFWRKVVKNYA